MGTPCNTFNGLECRVLADLPHTDLSAEAASQSMVSEEQNSAKANSHPAQYASQTAAPSHNHQVCSSKGKWDVHPKKGMRQQMRVIMAM